MRASEGAVTSVIGTLLLVAITVAVTGALALGLSNVQAPTDDRPAQVSIEIDAGLGGWGTGDEAFVVQHKGGKPLPSAYIHLHLRSPTMDDKVDAPPGAPFADGELNVGESWRVTRTITTGVVYHAVVAYGKDSSVALATTRFNLEQAADCSADVLPPKATAWTQNPGDIDADTLGAITIEATLSDNCSGVNLTALPTFAYRINDGSGPAWTTSSATLVSGTRVRGTVPEPAGTWNSHIGHTLEYQFRSMRDENGNTADTLVRTDLVTNPLVVTFIDCPPVVHDGIVTACVGWEDDDDGDLEARFDEDPTPGTESRVTVATSYIEDPDVTNDARAMGAPDSQYATLKNDDAQSRVGGFATGTGTIQGVRMLWRGQYAGNHVDDEVRFQYRLGGALTGSKIDFLPTTNDATQTLNVTADRTWTWSDIASLELESDFRRRGSEDSMDIKVDAMWIIVDVDTTNYHVDVEGNFTGVPSGTHELSVAYRVFVDTFDVQVWNATAAAWQSRGTLDQTTRSTWTHTLTADEYNAGNPRVRFKDLDTAGTPGILLIEHAKITSS